MTIFIIFLSLIIESIISYYFFISPILFISTLLICLIRYPDDKKTKLLVLGTSLIYDLFLGKVYFLYFTIFFIVYKVLMFIKSRFNSSVVFDFILFVFGIFLFRVLKLFILYWCGYIYRYPLLMIVDGLWLSIIFGIIIYYILGIKLRKA